MPVNIEIKARVPDRARLEEKTSVLADGPPQVLEQTDTFFRSPRGRLKLREEKGRTAQLIYYERSDQEDPEPSSYQIVAVESPAEMRELLHNALGTRGMVKKERTLYMTNETRIHLDRVAGLGDFMELEVVLQTGQSREWGAERARALMTALQVSEKDLIKVAYMDLLDNLGGAD